jgi:hypothetical protein
MADPESPGGASSGLASLIGTDFICHKRNTEGRHRSWQGSTMSVITTRSDGSVQIDFL